jgi:hypothetical protein
MLKQNKRGIIVTFVCALILAVFSGSGKSQPDVEMENISFRDIPGITQEEISAIEALKKKYDSFVYGLEPTVDAFIGADGETRGYAVLFCEWLSRIFVIPFRPAFYE